VTKSNAGTIILSGNNSYTGTITRIYGGALQANVGAGIPNQSAVILDGGIFQSNTAYTYTDKFWADVPDYRCLSWWSGGFAGGGGKMTVNLRGNGSTVSWTGNGDTGIAGDITLSSTTAQYEVEIVNALNLAGEERTIYVEDNTYSTGDFARISGNITGGDYDPGNGTGIHYGGIVKTGPGLLILSGAGNSYGDNNGDRGRTIIAAGVLQGNVPTASTIQLDGGVYQSSGTMTRGWYDEWYGNNITWNNGGFSAAGGKLTVNIDGDARTIYWTGNGHNGIGGTMILSSAFADSEVEIANPIDMYGGVRTIQVNDNPNSNGDFATLSGGLTNGGLIKTGPGQLQLVGPNVSYTGGTTISAGRLTLKDTTNFAGPVVNGGTLEINAATTDIVLAGNISNGAAVGEVIKNGPGKVTLTGANTYGDNVGWTGYTTVNQGVLQADRGVGLPAGSCLVLNGGVLQSNGVSTFNTGFWYDWGFLAWVNGGFAAGGGKLTVNLYGDSRTLNWGTDGYSTLAGNMVLGSNSAQYETEIQNGINLNGGARSIRVDDNPNTTGDFANLSGVLNDSVGGGSLTVTGAGTLRISGASGNTYSGATYLQGGNVELAKSAGYAVPGNLYLGGANSYFVSLLGNNQIAPTATVTWNSTGGWQEVKLLGHTLTVAGISDTSGRGVIENTWDETGYGTATLTVNNSASCSFNGYIRNQAFSGNTPLALVKNGSGTLTLSGPNTGGYTGGLTVNAGTLDYSGGTLPACPYTINGGTLNIGALSKSIGTFTITGGTVSGTGALTSSAAYNVQGGTVSAVLAGTVGLTKTGTGRTTLNGTNTYTGTTTVSAGVLQANNAAGLPNASFLSLNGGVLQANGTSTVTFTRGVATSGAGKFAWGTSGGGFAAGTAAMNVNVGGAGATVTWGTSGNVIKGTLKLGSTTSANVTTFQNPIALGSSTRTVQVDDNTGSTADYAVLSGAISGTGGLTKTGTGKLVLSNTGSSYTGTTTVSAGILAAVGASIDGPIAVNSGGTFSPGNSVGSVTTGAATWNSGGKYMFEIFSATGTAGTQWDLWNITGNLTDTSPFTVSAITESSNGVPGLMTNFVNTNSYTWTIASTTGTMPSNLISLLTLDSSGFQGMASTGRIYLTEAANYKTLYLNYAPTGGTGHAFTPVPEPGSIILLLTLAMPLGLGLYVKRRRS
jgi:autotransporter-associated beta strand protein